MFVIERGGEYIGEIALGRFYQVGRSPGRPVRLRPGNDGDIIRETAAGEQGLGISGAGQIAIDKQAVCR